MLSIEKDEDGNLSWKIGEQLMPQFAAGTALGMEDAKAYENYDLSDSLEGSVNALVALSNQVETYDSLQKQTAKDNTWGKVVNNINITRESVKKLCSVMTGLDDITAVKDLDKEMEDASQEAKEMAQAIQNFMSVTDITKDEELDVNKIKSAIEEIKSLALSEQKAIEGLGKGNFIQNPEDLNRLLEMFNKAKVAADEQAKIDAETQKGLELQAKLNNVIELTSAVGDLAFAWTSFQELGSLLANDDLSLGEKALQLITNLSFVIPQLIVAMQAFNLTKMKSQVAETATSLLDAAQGAGILAKGAGIAGTAMAKFSDILTLLIPYGKAIKIVLGGLAAALTIFGFTAQAEKNRVEALAKSAEDASTKLQNIKEGKANFDSIYEQYKKGQASSSELEDAAKTLNSTLNDQSLVVQSLSLIHI